MIPQLQDPWTLQQDFKSDRKISVFAEKILGLYKDPAFRHEGQIKWMDSSWKVINILNPANQWGKTLGEAIIHIYHAVTKPMLYGRVSDPETWNTVRYETINVGKTYEIAKGVMEMIKDIVNGELLLPDGTTNRSALKGWAITDYVDSMNRAPEIRWFNNAVTSFRSYDDLGSSFKRKRLAFVSADECGDIPELELFLNGTMLPRVAFWRGPIHLIGTHQPRGIDYLKICEKAELDIEINGDESDYYMQHGTLYENPYMDKDFIKKLENIADPQLRKQIIFGQYVDAGTHFFSYDEVSNMFRDEIPYDEDTGYSEAIDPEGHYIFSVDLAASEDETAVTVIRYNEFVPNWERKLVELPYKLVFHKGFQGKTIPISMQYELIRGWFNQMRDIAENISCDINFLYDAGSLGGKNAEDAFRDLNGLGFPGTGKSYAQEKAYAIGALKDVIARGRRVVKSEDGKWVDVKKNWGFLRASSKLKELRRQFESYALDDKGLRQDRIATVYMAIHYIEKRRPRLSHESAIDMDIMGSTIPNYG